jgi:hypothetical protein
LLAGNNRKLWDVICGNASPELKRTWKMDAADETDNQINKDQFIYIYKFILPTTTAIYKYILPTTTAICGTRIEAWN